jgi:hypothetical protein
MKPKTQLIKKKIDMSGFVGNKSFCTSNDTIKKVKTAIYIQHGRKVL